MTIYEALLWLDEHQRESMVATLENIGGFDVSDLAIAKINEACRVACNVMRAYLNAKEAMDINA